MERKLYPRAACKLFISFLTFHICTCASPAASAELDIFYVNFLLFNFYQNQDHEIVFSISQNYDPCVYTYDLRFIL